MHKAPLEEITHPFAPVYNDESRILILGSFPSVLSRQNSFYYGNPRNRFWTVLASLLHVSVPNSIEEKTQFLLKNHIAVWDALASCAIHASSDATITRAVPNDFTVLFEAAPIQRVFANGRAAYRYYVEFNGDDITYLPSTSPANAAYSLARLEETWSVILPFLTR